MDEKKKTRRKKWLILAVCLCLAAILIAIPVLNSRNTSAHAADLMEGISPKITGEAGSPSEAVSKEATDFAARIFKQCCDSNSNTLISPLSILYALSMTANGAQGETLSQMEKALGAGTDELNKYFRAYLQMASADERCQLNIANSIWFNDNGNFTANPAFLQTNADYYDAGIYKTKFNQAVCKDINDWVKDKTDGMIEKVIDKIPESAIMYLINALSFDAKWSSQYEDVQVQKGKFIKEDGKEQDADFMYSSEYNYIEDENTTGFIKPYEGPNYAFAALLPREGISIDDYIDSLTGEKIQSLLTNSSFAHINASLPKFESGTSLEIQDMLRNMGMTDAFDIDKADLSEMGSLKEGNIFIEKVIHKTAIEVTQSGTKAAAVTAVMADEATAAADEIKEVRLDRPFLYMIIDRGTNLPIFIGVEREI